MVSNKPIARIVFNVGCVIKGIKMKSLFLTLLVISSFVKAELNSACPYKDISTNCGSATLNYRSQIGAFVECYDLNKKIKCLGEWEMSSFKKIENHCRQKTGIIYPKSVGFEGDSENESLFFKSCMIQKLTDDVEAYTCGCDL